MKNKHKKQFIEQRLVFLKRGVDNKGAAPSAGVDTQTQRPQETSKPLSEQTPLERKFTTEKLFQTLNSNDSSTQQQQEAIAKLQQIARLANKDPRGVFTLGTAEALAWFKSNDLLPTRQDRFNKILWDQHNKALKATDQAFYKALSVIKELYTRQDLVRSMIQQHKMTVRQAVLVIAKKVERDQKMRNDISKHSNVNNAYMNEVYALPRNASAYQKYQLLLKYSKIARDKDPSKALAKQQNLDNQSSRQRQDQLQQQKQEQARKAKEAARQAIDGTKEIAPAQFQKFNLDQLTTVIQLAKENYDTKKFARPNLMLAKNELCNRLDKKGIQYDRSQADAAFKLGGQSEEIRTVTTLLTKLKQHKQQEIKKQQDKEKAAQQLAKKPKPISVDKFKSMTPPEVVAKVKQLLKNYGDQLTFTSLVNARNMMMARLDQMNAPYDREMVMSEFQISGSKPSVTKAMNHLVEAYEKPLYPVQATYLLYRDYFSMSASQVPNFNAMSPKHIKFAISLYLMIMKKPFIKNGQKVAINPQSFTNYFIRPAAQALYRKSSADQQKQMTNPEETDAFSGSNPNKIEAYLKQAHMLPTAGATNRMSYHELNQMRDIILPNWQSETLAKYRKPKKQPQPSSNNNFPNV